MLYSPVDSQHESLKAINFFNMVKKVLVRSGGLERKINLRILIDLIHELRVKLDITKAGLVPPKIQSQINAGDSGEIKDEERARRIEKIVLSEFSTINLAKVKGAIVAARRHTQ